MAMDDFAPAGPEQLSDELDQDLFDFPPMEEPKVSAPAPEAAAPAPTAAPAAASTGGYTGMDEDLDLDIFDFPPLIDSSRTQAPAIAGGDLEESIEQAAKAVSELLEDDLGEMIAVHERDLAERDAVDAPTVAPAAPAAAAPVATPAPATAPTTVAVSAAPSKVQWVLVGALIVFMVGVLGIAWRLTSSFSDSLERVRDDVELGNQALESQNAAQMRRIDELQRELLAQQALASQQVAVSTETPRQFTARTPAELTILAAQASIESGEFAAARQMLFRDLASADSMPIDQRESTVQRMELLIAQSFELQARQLQEEGR
jgi:HAMP domain-containing protein